MADHATGIGPTAVPPLFAQLVDDTSLLRRRGAASDVGVAVARYLADRDGPLGGLVGQLVCPVSRLSSLVAELARARPDRPVDVSLVVDTGLGAVPKALSTVFSRSGLITPRTVETAAPPDVDAIWLERVAEFVPDDVVAVVEPRRPMGAEEDGVANWLDAVRRVAKHGCTPKLRCGGSRSSEVPSVADVDRFVRVVAEAGRGFVALGALPVVGAATPDGGSRLGVLNLLVGAARALAHGAVAEALASTDGPALAREALALSRSQVREVRALLPRCGAGTAPVPAAELSDLHLLG